MAVWLCGCVPVVQPLTARLNAGRSLFLGGLARVDYINDEDDDSVLLTWFGQLDIHLTSTART